MYRFRALFTVHTLVLASFVFPAFAQRPGSMPQRGFVPRHDRLATSILRRTQASTPVSAAPGETSATADPFDAPPSPPATSLAAPPEEMLAPAEPEIYVDGVPPLLPDEAIGAGCGPGGCDSGELAFACDDCGTCPQYCWIDTLSLWVGANGFKGPFNRGEDGSFGFQEGFNWGSPWVFTPIGMNTQIGLRGTQTNFNGAEFTGDDRSQAFVTAGFFRRADWGWQGGLVYDYMHEDWYVGMDLSQLRGEISWAVPRGSSFGFAFTASLNEDDVRLPNNLGDNRNTWETHDIYTAFYRVRSPARGGQWRVLAGFTGDSDGIIGSDFKIPMIGTCALESEFTYLIPDESTGTAHEREAWNVAINLVWYPGRAVNGLNFDMLPLFDVAGNGSMIARRK